ncbi:MAG: peptidoglycan DD-metalloendopeptidase family protein [Pseudomonadales bacterium]|nr:peptidoglycan DD-metalloendopeptidase family protein [Pseudomonadales bacterium]NIX09593.1 peptidoglycan DD-metalloendopeptidase family protein [Pseudomonadales bacterium]
MNSLPKTAWQTRRRAGCRVAVARFVAILTILFTAPLSSSSEREDAQRELEAVVGQLNALDVWLDEAEERRVRWLGEVKAKDREVATVSEAVDEAAAALAAVMRSLDELEDEQRELQAKRERQATKIGEHLAAAYRLDGRDFVQLLLNQESPDSFDRMIRYHRYFSAARLSALQEYQETLEALAANRTALKARAAEQEDRKAELAKRQFRLIEERDQRMGLIAQLDAEAEDKTAQRQRLDTDRDRLERLLEELNRRAMALDGTDFVARRGSLPWPLKGPLRSSFGRPRADGRMVWHGMLVAADEGSPVKAVFRGRVIFADWLRGFGLLAIINHGGGYMTLYGHADSLTKGVGDWVESGEIIARAGRSGGQRASGLYFEVREEGVPRDPLGWLAKR